MPLDIAHGPKLSSTEAWGSQQQVCSEPIYQAAGSSAPLIRNPILYLRPLPQGSPPLPSLTQAILQGSLSFQESFATSLANFDIAMQNQVLPRLLQSRNLAASLHKQKAHHKASAGPPAHREGWSFGSFPTGLKGSEINFLKTGLKDTVPAPTTTTAEVGQKCAASPRTQSLKKEGRGGPAVVGAG